jgi:Protein of unknown function (DUF3987)
MIDRALLAEFCRSHALAICRHFAPKGYKKGNAWIVADTTLAEGNSLHMTVEGEEAGLWYDFAAAEGGDIPQLLMAHFQVSFPEAVEFIERAFGVDFRIASRPQESKSLGGAPVSSAERSASRCVRMASATPRGSLCVVQFPERHLIALAQWRNYTIDFCRWLKSQGLIVLYKKHLAFPTEDGQSKIVGYHYYVKDSGGWRYSPGCRVTPLVIGDLHSASRIDVFESYWDGLDFADKMHFSETENGCALIVTRGASNGHLVEGLLLSPDRCEVYVWPQRDVARENGTVPSTNWLDAIKASAGRPVKVAWIPNLHPDRDFDFNDWTRELANAGASRERIVDEIISVTSNAEPIPWKSIIDLQQIQDQESDQRDPFPLDALPQVAQKMTDEVCKAELVPPSLVACAILGIASASIGAGLCIQSGAARSTRGNLHLMAIAESGVGKWSSYRHVNAPLNTIEKELIETWKHQVRPKLLTEIDALEADCKKMKDLFAKEKDQDQKRALLEEMTKTNERIDQLREKAVEPCLCVGDATKEAMAVTMSQQVGESLASISSEGRGIIDVLCGQYSNGSSDEDFFIAGYTGDSIKVNRISRPSIWLNHPCLAVFWMFQPDKLATILGKTNLTESGMLQRFLICDTQAEPQEVPAQDYLIDSRVFAQWGSRIRELIESYRWRKEPATIQPTSEAKELFRGFTNEIVRRRRKGGDLQDIQTYAARWAEQAWRISVVLHALENGPGAHIHRLDAAMAEKAIRVARWFAERQMAVLAQLRSERKHLRFEKLSEILEDKPEKRSTLNDLKRRHGFEEAEVRNLAAEFCHKLEIKTVKQPKGRPGVFVGLRA